jgi:hypothetical protein
MIPHGPCAKICLITLCRSSLRAMFAGPQQRRLPMCLGRYGLKAVGGLWCDQLPFSLHSSSMNRTFLCMFRTRYISGKSRVRKSKKNKNYARRLCVDSEAVCKLRIPMWCDLDCQHLVSGSCRGLLARGTLCAATSGGVSFDRLSRPGTLPLDLQGTMPSRCTTSACQVKGVYRRKNRCPKLRTVNIEGVALQACLAPRADFQEPASGPQHCPPTGSGSSVPRKPLYARCES